MWKIINKYYLEISEHFQYIIIDAYIIMPNHIHFVVFIGNKKDVNFKEDDIIRKGVAIKDVALLHILFNRIITNSI